MKDRIWFITLVALAVSLAEFPVKLFWPFAGQSIAVVMGICPIIFGTRDLKRSIYVLILVLVGLTIIPYITQPEALASNNFVGFNPWNRLVMILAFAVFSVSRLENRRVIQIGAAMAIACFWIALVGWYRFLTHTGGLAVEHAFNYWGVRYGIATRNADVLYVMMALWLESTLTSVWWRCAVFIVCVPAALLSYARSAWLSLLAFFLRLNQLPLLLAGAFLLVQTAILSGSGTALLERFTTIFTYDDRASNVERANLLLFSLSRITVFGRGPGQFIGSDAVDRAFSTLRHPENFVVLMASEMGVLAVLTFLAIWAWIMRLSPLRRIGISLSIYLMLNSELDNIVIWLVIGLLFHTAMNAAEAVPVRASQPAGLDPGGLPLAAHASIMRGEA